MATTKRALRHARQAELTDAQSWSLLIGGMDGFTDAAAYEQAWWQHREELMASVNPTTRPEGWWQFEFDGERPRGETEYEVLARHGLLTAEEVRLAKRWGLREQVERMREYRARVAEQELSK